MMQLGFNNNSYQSPVNLFTIDAVGCNPHFVSIGYKEVVVTIQPKTPSFIFGEKVVLPILKQLGNFWSYLNQSSSNVGEISSATAHKYAVGSVPVPSRTPVPGPVGKAPAGQVRGYSSYPLWNPVPGPVENYIPGPVESYIPGPVENCAPGPVENYIPGPVEHLTPGPVENYIPGPEENLPDFIYGPVMNIKN